MLEQFVEKNPRDAFGRYGLAMECMKEGDIGGAEVHFKKLITDHPDYVAAYYQYGRMLAAENRAEDAKKILIQGVSRAEQAGDAHAQQEMQATLDELS